ncbi:uncharacterized protein BP5553_00713 [Venustampulla echinocandica]|uniref:MJ1316 RNA cyclic group end recognition domain-containing protein n=1 Tax=Venustampulla echinocandica TaxID=2656787 RepID=A0A370TYZ3_9HELO|nr:uncharacterized protein BP5553_00713 [Venustampulla echinocandica]RDL40734.1 hypothetical protein BP5553_00713 [Venustampulla echinocandica]
MADLHHGTFSYSTGPTAADVLPRSQSENARSQLVEDSAATQKLKALQAVFLSALKTSLDAHSSALPILSFSPIHALALELEPFEEEPLKAIAFGNISPDNYIDLFWDITNEQNELSWGKFTVYEAEQSSEPRFLVCFKAQLFELRYIRCDVLVREYPEVSDAPDSFLQDPQNSIHKSVQDAVQMIRRGTDMHDHLDEFPSIRTAYSYIKRWAAIRGLANAFPDHHIFKSLLKYQKTNPDLATPRQVGDPSSSALITEFFKQDAPKTDSIPAPTGYSSFITKDWENLLVKLDSLRLDEKCAFPHTIRVAVTYSGRSPVKGAQWLLMVQRRLDKLKDRLESRIPNTPIVQIWPQRLVSEDAMLGDNVYEGHFVLGLRLSPATKQADLQSAQEIAETWRKQVENDKATLKNQCFVRIVVDNIPTGLKICGRKWPRVILTGENTNHSDSDGESSQFPKKKRSKSPLASSTSTPHSSDTKAKRFRTASEVLNRLKFDNNYNIDEWAIGYIDRVRDMILEKPASDWDRETTAEEFIPEHRIEYFKRYSPGGEGEVGEERGEIMWSKKQKLDEIFRSG